MEIKVDRDGNWITFIDEITCYFNIGENRLTMITDRKQWYHCRPKIHTKAFYILQNLYKLRFENFTNNVQRIEELKADFEVPIYSTFDKIVGDDCIIYTAKI